MITLPDDFFENKSNDFVVSLNPDHIVRIETYERFGRYRLKLYTTLPDSVFAATFDETSKPRMERLQQWLVASITAWRRGDGVAAFDEV